MSVINNVLKDLEARESRFTPIELSSVQAPASVSRARRLYYLLALVVLLVAVAGWYLVSHFDLPGQLRAAVPAAAPVEPPASVARVIEAAASNATAVANPVSGNEIVGLQIRETEEEIRLEFALKERVVAYLKERGENSFGYHLRDIDNQIVAPVLRDNPWVRALSLVPRDNGIDVNFATVPDILVETRQSVVDGEPVWYISLRKSMVAQVEPEIAPAEDNPAVSTQAPPANASAAAVTEPVEPKPPSAPVPAAEVKVEIKTTNPAAKTINQLEYAVELINSRRIGDAEKLLRGLIGGVEDYAARQHLLALYQRQNLTDRFDRLVRESMTRYPDKPLFRTEYARQLFQRADYRAVIRLFSAQLELDANQQALLGASHQRLDQHEEAVSHYQRALALDDANAKNWIGLGISQEHLSALGDALNSYQTAGRLGSLNQRLQAFVDKRSETLAQVLN